MNPPTIQTRTLPKKKAKEREDLVKDILRRGNVAAFTHDMTGAIKYVNTWNPDPDGELFAYRRRGGTTPYICWESPHYTVSEVTREEALK